MLNQTAKQAAENAIDMFFCDNFKNKKEIMAAILKKEYDFFAYIVDIQENYLPNAVKDAVDDAFWHNRGMDLAGEIDDFDRYFESSSDRESYENLKDFLFEVCNRAVLYEAKDITRKNMEEYEVDTSIFTYTERVELAA